MALAAAFRRRFAEGRRLSAERPRRLRRLRDRERLLGRFADDRFAGDRFGDLRGGDRFAGDLLGDLLGDRLGDRFGDLLGDCLDRLGERFGDRFRSWDRSLSLPFSFLGLGEERLRALRLRLRPCDQPLNFFSFSILPFSAFSYTA